jgi:2,4-dienoyl-CoA reductase-like NADH-dependent reductase (Old Yellow Enzyme family)
MGEEILNEGKADFISMGRQSIADPDFANKVMKN